MDIFNKQMLDGIIDSSENINLTGYIPTVRYNGAEKNRIEIKNFIQNVQSKLKNNGFSEELIEEWVSPIRSLLNQKEFQNNLSDCIAIFRNSSHFSYHVLPIEVKHELHLGKHFYVVPLIPMIDADSSAYVISVSAEKIRVLHMTHNEISELDFSKDFPQNITVAHWHVDRSPNQQSHGSNPQDVHGHGGSKDARQEDLKRFFRDVTDGLEPFFKEKNDKIILAGVDRTVTIFKEVFTNPNVISQRIRGNFDGVSILDIHFEAKTILENLDKKEKYSIRIEEWHPEKKIDNERDIVDKSLGGLVETLYLHSADAKIPGNVFLNGLAADTESAQVNVIEADYVNQAVLNTLKTGGNVVVNPKATHGKEMLATLRF